MDWASLRSVFDRPRGRFGIRLGDVGMAAVVPARDRAQLVVLADTHRLASPSA